MSQELKRLAQECRSYLEHGTRTSGQNFVKCTEKAPEWFQELCQNAHCGVLGLMLPDDWRYRFIAEALAQLDDFDGEREEAGASLEPDVYIGDVLDWLGSHRCRYVFVDEAVALFDHANSITDDIARGQLEEKLEVFHIVANALEERLEGATDETA